MESLESLPHRSSCPISSSLDVLGDKWSLLVVRDMLFAGSRTFSEFLVSGEGIATNILASRLVRLEASGIITSEPDPSDRRRSLYSLTQKGRDLAPVLLALSDWGVRYERGARNQFHEAYERDPAALIRQLRQAPPT
jgi:DNA-binding HxlR family transcriptional regulator